MKAVVMLTGPVGKRNVSHFDERQWVVVQIPVKARNSKGRIEASNGGKAQPT
jgi:hypothetical protein